METNIQELKDIKPILFKIYSLLALHLEELSQPTSSVSIKQLAHQIQLMTKTLIQTEIHNRTLYQNLLQSLQSKLRKHIKNQIELKLYYQHLEKIIQQMKIDQQNNQKRHQQQLQQLQTQISLYKDKLILTAYQTKKSQSCLHQYQQKIQTLSKIKNRLCLQDPQQFLINSNPYISKRQSFTYKMNSIHKKKKSKDSSDTSNKKNSRKNSKDSKSIESLTQKVKSTIKLKNNKNNK